MSDIVLLGAGASVEAGVPSAFSMTERLVEAFSVDHYRWSKHAQALNFVCGTLLAHDAAQGSNPYEGLDVERVFAAVQLLAERRSLEVTPFVASWHPAVDEWDRPSLPGFFDRDLLKELIDGSFDRGRDRIVGLIRDVTAPGTGEIYRELSEQMIEVLRPLLATDSADLAYLTPLVERANDDGGLTVATLNYDLAIEQACQRAGIAVDTGIQRWTDTRDWSWPKGGVRLLKLHGSVDWEWDESPAQRGVMSRASVVQRETDTDDGFRASRRPALIFGGREKLRAEGPFLSLLAQFEEQLLRSTRLIVIGYSFRDPHINELIRRWTHESSQSIIVVVDPDFGGVSQHAFGRELVTTMGEDVYSVPKIEPRLNVREQPASVAIQRLFGKRDSTASGSAPN